MLDFILHNYQILTVIAIALAILVIRFRNARLEEKRRTEEGKRIVVWHRTLERCREADDYRLEPQELARFSDSGMLKAFEFMAGQEGAGSCERVLEANSAELVRRISEKADTEEKGFFAYMLSEHGKGLGAKAEKVYTEFLFDLLLSDSVYCRENALRALYGFGNAEDVARAVKVLSDAGKLHNEKLLSDGLASFSGDAGELSEALMKLFPQLDDHSQSAVVTFFTFAGIHSYDGFFRDRVAEADVSTDQRCDIFRLLMKAPCEETKEILIRELLENGSSGSWEAAAVAATGLSSYPGDGGVISALLEQIKSPHWDVRMNCAFSLVRLGPGDDTLNGILSGGDAYAADALRFALSAEGKAQQ